MTSNVGAMLIQNNLEHLSDKNRQDVLERTKNEVFELLKKTMRPEFLNRVDELIMFTPLTKEEIKEIVRLQFNHVMHKLAENEIQINITEKAVQWIAEQGYDPQFGARPIKRLIQKNILNELSKKILEGTIKKDQSVMIDCSNGEISFVNQKTVH
jgi:ATP-dependent Clp protease ATP-binding subunit ClpB